MLERLRQQARAEDERLQQLKKAKEDQKEEEKKQRATSAVQPQNQDQSAQSAGLGPLPDMASISKPTAVGYGGKKGPIEEIIDGPVASAQPASITQPQSAAAAGSGQESLEERKLRLMAHRESLKKKKQEQEAANRTQEEEAKRDEGDIFRNTQMKFNESPEQKKLRLKRCLKALSQAGVGKPSAFVGMQVGKPINIEWNR